MRTTNRTFPASLKCWKSWSRRTWFASSLLMTGNEWVCDICCIIYLWPIPISFILFHLQYCTFNVIRFDAVDCGVLQQARGQVEGRSQADVSKDHLQVGHFWISFLWSEGNNKTPFPAAIDCTVYTELITLTTHCDSFFLFAANYWAKFSWNPTNSHQQAWSQSHRPQNQGVSQNLHEFVSSTSVFEYTWVQSNQTNVLMIRLFIAVFPFPGYFNHSPLYKDLQLEQWKHLLPHYHRQPGARKQAALWNISGQ